MNLLQHRAHIGHRSHFDREPKRKPGTSFGDFRGFIDVGHRQKKISADHFLRFCKRTINHRLPARAGHDATFQCERTAVFHFSLGGESVIPIVPRLRKLSPTLGIQVLMGFDAGIAEEQQEGT